MFPSELANYSKIFYSKSDNNSFKSSSYYRQEDFFYSKSGFSLLIIKLRSFPSRPLRVTVKFTNVIHPSSDFPITISLFLVLK
jgi:hypothetical protein